MNTEKDLKIFEKITNFNKGLASSLDIFEEEHDLKILTLKVQCPKCGHIWGIKVDDYNLPIDIPDKKFKCSICE